MVSDKNDIILEMKNITKTFPGVKALDNVNLKVKKGEIHSLCGENGAGKSTLMKVLSGIYPYGDYEGEILYNGKTCKYKDVKDSEHDGIVIIHQELALSPYLSIGENIFMGNEIAKHGVIDWNEVRIRTKELLAKVGLNEDPDTIVNTLGVGKQQLIEIAKALSKDVKLLILDEPTASLNEDDSENLLNLMLELKSNGITSILISHKLNEVSKVCDSITVLRDGATIETLDATVEKISEDRIVKGMVGRELTERYPKRVSKIGDVLFEVNNWNVYHPDYSDRKDVDNVNIKVKKGEVLGIAGLMGAYGAALISKENYKEGEVSTLIREDKLENFDFKTTCSRCGGCGNNCLLTINKFDNEEKYITGNRCERPLGNSAKKLEVPNLYKYKLARIFNYKPLAKEDAIRGEIGIPRALNIYENYPFWFTLLTELKFRVIISPFSSKKIFNLGIETIPSESVCYPAKLSHGHIMSVIDR